MLAKLWIVFLVNVNLNVNFVVLFLYTKPHFKRNSQSAFLTAYPMDNINEINTSCRLHSSHNSTISNESDLSLLSLSLDKEVEANVNSIDIDELPAFEIRLISPLGRTPSPIDSEDNATPTKPLLSRLAPNPCQNNPEYVAIHEINAQISPPRENRAEDESSLSRTSSLETIFEGVFLNTPPRQHLNLQNNRINRNRTSLLEKVAINRLNIGKENQSPISKRENSPSGHKSIEFSSVKDSRAVTYENHTFS